MATNDDPKKGKGNATPPANGDETKVTKAEFEQLKATNQQLQTQLGEVQSIIVSPQFQEFMKSKNQPAQEFDRGSFAAGRQELDLETMDRTQFAQYILKQITDAVGKQFNPQLARLSDDMQRDQLTRGIKEAQSKYGDFDNYAAQMRQASSRIATSGLSAEDIYKIATHTGPKKAEGKEEGGKPGTQTTEKPGGAGGELSAGTDKETPKETAARIFDELKLGDKKA